ncbi:hypothetical protein FA15DRAFT_610801 [Coprinopsis marcescibilis]|uniref:Uncharacterized protein n=1 Tax=Coprinopsis marcescibilis TaxID=230819 RepID=A0A5C3L8U9_COPMA|nr:hypothetical protein FA15DRAFT_610801 [Coprinopsis marcescibilis]
MEREQVVTSRPVTPVYPSAPLPVVEATFDAEVSVSRVRKRVDSNSSMSPSSSMVYKRPRISVSSLSGFLESPSTPGPSTSYLDMSMRLTLDMIPPRIEPNPVLSEARRRRSLSRKSSATSLSGTTSPMFNVDLAESLRARLGNPRSDSYGLRRSVSATSLSSSSTPTEVTYASESARKYMRNPKFFVDYATPTPARLPIPPPPPPPVPIIIPGLPPLDPPPQPPHITDPRLLTPPVNANVLSCSVSGILFFTRTNRIHFKNLLASEEVGQMCKSLELHGTYTAIVCGGEANPNMVAVSTSKGVVAIYDVQTKKRLMNWSTKPVSALAWNGKILTVGHTSGTIRHYDTRITPLEKMKEQAATLSRHQCAVTRMEWSVDGEILATADKKGNVFCWKRTGKVPMDVGDFGQRRKKMKHPVAVSALAWCPWQLKVLLSADVRGTIHFWKVDDSVKESNALTPAKLETGAAITSIVWSTQCKEFLTTHGYKTPPLSPNTPSPPPSYCLRNLPPSHNIENTLAVWQFPSIRFVTNMRMNTTDIPLGNSVAYSQNTKVVFTVPEEGKIHTCDVWGKRKNLIKLRRQSSLDYVGLIR